MGLLFYVLIRDGEFVLTYLYLKRECIHLQSHLWGEFSAFLLVMPTSDFFLLPPGTKHCLLGRGSME